MFCEYTQIEEHGEDEDEEGDMEIGEAGKLRIPLTCFDPSVGYKKKCETHLYTYTKGHFDTIVVKVAFAVYIC